MNKNEKIVFTAARRSGKSLIVREQLMHKIFDEIQVNLRYIIKSTEADEDDVFRPLSGDDARHIHVMTLAVLKNLQDLFD